LEPFQVPGCRLPGKQPEMPGSLEFLWPSRKIYDWVGPKNTYFPNITLFLAMQAVIGAKDPSSTIKR